VAPTHLTRALDVILAIVHGLAVGRCESASSCACQKPACVGATFGWSSLGGAAAGPASRRKRLRAFASLRSGL
jgi:hypothetical protein